MKRKILNIQPIDTAKYSQESEAIKLGGKVLTLTMKALNAGRPHDLGFREQYVSRFVVG